MSVEIVGKPATGNTTAREKGSILDPGPVPLFFPENGKNPVNPLLTPFVPGKSYQFKDFRLSVPIFAFRIKFFTDTPGRGAPVRQVFFRITKIIAPLRYTQKLSIVKFQTV